MLETLNAQQQNFALDVEIWEHELDCLGPLASHEALRKHLSKAPDNAPTRAYLTQFCSSGS